MTALEQPDSVLAAASLPDWPAWLRACSIDIESNPAQDNCIFRLAAFAEQMQRAADKGDAETLDALGEQLRDVLDEDLCATLSDMHERLHAGLDQPPRQQPPAAPVPQPRRRTAP